MNTKDYRVQNDKADSYLLNAVPSHWKIKKGSGAEFLCEVHPEKSFIILSFTVFLKTRSSEDRKDRVFLKKISRAEFNSLQYPVFITAYLEDEEKAFWDWKHSAYITETEENIKIAIPRSNELQGTDWHLRPEADLVRFFLEEHFLFRLPENTVSEKQKKGWGFFLEKKYKDALENFQSSEDDPLILNASAVCFWKLNQVKEAVTQIERAVLLAKDNRLDVIRAYILAEYGIIEKDIQSLKRSIQILTRHSSEFSESCFFHYYIGRTAMEPGVESSVDSISEMHSALTIRPDFIPAKIALGICHDSPYAPEAGRPGPHDISYFNEVLAEHPDHPEALLWKLLSFCKLNTQTKEHLETLVKILEENPILAKIHRDSWKWISKGYENLNEKDLALKYYERANT